MATITNYYNSEEYREKLEEVKEHVQELKEENEKEALEKRKRCHREKSKLKKIFNAERCGQENMHFVESLIDRASFLRAELESIEKKLQKEGCMDYFVQGTQTLWREHPLSKIHVAHSKSYRDTIAKLEAYGKNQDSGDKGKPNGLIGLISKGNDARNKYRQ